MVDDSSDSNHFDRKCKLIYTVALCLLNSAYGLLNEITASTLVDIAEQTSSSLEDVTFGLVVKTIAQAFGCLFFGWAFERMNRQLGVAFVLTAMAVNTAITPFESSLIMFQASMFVNGICGAAVDIGEHDMDAGDVDSFWSIVSAHDVAVLQFSGGDRSRCVCIILVE